MSVSTFQLGDFHLFHLLQFVVAPSVFLQQPAVVLALDLVLLLQLVILLLQVVMLVLTEEIITWSNFVFFITLSHVAIVKPLDKQLLEKKC